MKNILLIACLLWSLHSFAQLPPYAPSNGIVGFWTFNGGPNDVSGNGNNGTVVGGAVLTTNRLGAGNAAYYFPNTAPNCSSSYIHTDINTAAIAANNAMTVSFWAYRSGDGCKDTLLQGFIEFGNCFTTCTDQLQIYWPNGEGISIEQVFPANEIGFEFTGTVADNTWYHIAYSYDGTVLKYYLNGLLVKTVPLIGTVQLNGNTNFGAGNPLTNGAVNGKLYDIGLWSRALTDCEVHSLYSGDPSHSFAYNPLQDTTLICDSIILDAGAGYSNYAWSNGAGTETISAKQNGLSKVTVTNIYGCTASDSTLIDIIKPGISASKTIVCKGDNVTLNVTGVAGTTQTLVDQFDLTTNAPYSHTTTTVPGMNYVMSVSGIWSVHFCTDPNNVSDAAYYYERTPITALPNNLDLVMWNGIPVRPDGNTYNASHIYSYTLPAATQTSQTFTFTDPGTYTDNCGMLSFLIYNVQKSSATFLWSTGETTPTINVSPQQTTMYYVTVNDGATSCMDSILITVTAVDTSLTVLDPLAVCSGNANVRFTAGTDNSYKWLLNNAPVAGATAVNYTATQTGVYSVAVTNGAGCIDTSRTVSVSLQPKPVAGFTVNNPVQCLSGNSFVFTNTSSITSGTLSYQWNLGDGQKAISKDTTYTYTAANNNYPVQLISISNNGCSDTVTNTVTVKPASATPTITAGGPTTFCQNGTVLLTSDVPVSNQWYKDGTAVAGAANQTYTASASGTYTAIANTNNCASDASAGILITVNPVPAAPTITAEGPVAFCQNENVLLTSNAATGNQWFKDGTAITGAININYTASTAGVYTANATTDNCTSAQGEAITITIKPLTPAPTITANGPLSFCESGSVVLSSDAASGNQWYQNGVPLNQANDNTYTVSVAGTFTVIASPANACPSNASEGVSISIIPSPAGIRYDAVNTSVNNPTVLTARTFGEAYTWSPSLGIDEADIATPTFNYSETTDYVIRITTSAGCYTYDSLLVNVYTVKGILVPTAFTPNGDGLNDVLKAFPISIKEFRYFRIYNKWGQLIFESTDPSIGWDGSYKGTAQSPGNYIWIAQAVDTDGKVINEHGQTILIR